MKKFLLLALATLLISPSIGETDVKSSNRNNLVGNNSNSVTSEQNEDKYKIRFLNDEGSVLSSKRYEFGESPEAPDTPSKENPLDEYTYTFSGWSPSISLVTADTDYVATYKADAKIGEVKWVDGDGETLLTENYAYGSMPNYHGDIPTKTATDTETYVFKGWSPEVGVVSKESTTYVAQFSSVYAKYSIQINCTDCLVNKKKSINEKHNPLTDLTYQFNNTSKETYHYPYKIEVTVDGKATNDYAYDNITGKLNIKLTGNTVINAVADNSCVLMEYKYSADYPTVEITCDGDFERVDWGDGTTVDATSKSHTYLNPDVDRYDIKIFGKLSDIGTTSKTITRVSVFHSITSIRNFAFSNCSSLTSITIPNSVTSIGNSAFAYCSSLTSITIPNSVTSIRNFAFSNCSSLASVIISNSVTTIGSNAFYDCSSLATITIPNSVTSIGGWAFSSYPSFLVIYCEAESKPSGWDSEWNYDDRPVVWGYIGDGEYNNLKYGVSSIGGNKSIVITEFVNKSATAIEIPSTIKVNDENIPVVTIGSYAFSNCYYLTSITIPSNITSIGYSAFSNCSSLVTITIPSSITSIGGCAFSNCSSLVTITIPSSITSIGSSAFANCSSLATIFIPNGVASVGGGAFMHCSSLIIYCEVESKPSGWDSVWNYSDRPVVWGYIGDGEYNNLKYGVSSIGGNKSIVITEFVNKSATAIEIPSTIKVNDENIPVVTISNYAFSNCYYLTSITIPSSITSIGYSAFMNCSSLIIYCEAESKPSGWDSEWNCDDRPVVWGYIGDGEYNNLKYGVSSIGGNKSIVITEFVNKSATAIEIPSTIKVNDENIPVVTISNYAFSNCYYLTSITIPSSITSIGYSAFSNCSSLATITIPNSVTSIGNSAFSRCSSLTSITIPNGITKISSYAFYYCYKLTSIIIPNSVTSISNFAFSNCSSLASVIISNSVTTIGSNAFYDCSSLATITIPNSVTSIGYRAFSNCSSLESFDLSNLNHVISIESRIFSSGYIPVIKVKNSMLEEYKTDSVWSQYSEYMYGV